MDKETLKKVLDILRKERVHLASAISGYYDVIKEEAEKEDADALLDAIMGLHDCEVEQATLRRVCYQIEKHYYENFEKQEHTNE